MYRKWTWTTTLECNKEEGENERGDGEREGESGGTVEVTENREINRQPIPPFTRRVSFIGSDNKKSVTEINWRTSRSIISELSSFLYRRGVVTRQRKRYTCAQRWGTNVVGISLYFAIRFEYARVTSFESRGDLEWKLDYPSLQRGIETAWKCILFARGQWNYSISVYEEYGFQSLRIFSTRGADSRVLLLLSTRAHWPCVFPETKFRSLTSIYDEREWKFNFPRSDYARFPMKS